MESGLKLYPKQEEVVDRFKTSNHGALLLGMGVGKTAITINILKHHIFNLDNQSKKILIFCPSIVIKNWAKEIKTFFPACPYRVCASTKDGAKRKKEIEKFISDNEEYGILVVNYEVSTSSLGPIIEKFKPDTLVLDESHLVKNPKSKRSKYILKLRKAAKKCFILTGTVLANSIEDAFQQFLIMDLGKTFGTNFFTFRRKYMVDLNAGWSGSANYFPKYVPNPRLMPDFKERLLKSSVVKNTEEMIDLPESVPERYYVKLSKEQEKHYRNLKKLMVTEIKENDLLTVENALTKMLRLTQICSGHLPDSEGEITFFKDFEKINTLKTIVSEVISGKEKCIIWTCFKADVTLITKSLKDMGLHNLLFMTGDQSTQEKAEAEALFRDDTRFNVIICNLQSASTGVNLQAAKHAIYYSRNFSYTLNTQSLKRNRRGGSIDLHDKVIVHDIITEDTVEEDILDALTQKESLSNYVLDNLDSLGADKRFKEEILNKFLDEE